MMQGSGGADGSRRLSSRAAVANDEQTVGDWRQRTCGETPPGLARMLDRSSQTNDSVHSWQNNILFDADENVEICEGATT